LVEQKPLTRQHMAARLADEFESGWLVNLGIGIPTMISNYAKDVLFHSENGVIGYGSMLPEGEENPYLVNAGGQHVDINPGASIVHHADAFAIIRAGYIDVSIMGSYEVSETGDFANWRTSGRKGGGIGGAMDLAMGAQRVFIAMEHTTRDGKPRLLKQLNLPATALGVVTTLMTNLGLFDITSEGFLMREIAPGYTPEQVQELTDAHLVISLDLKDVDVQV